MRSGGSTRGSWGRPPRRPRRMRASQAPTCRFRPGRAGLGWTTEASRPPDRLPPLSLEQPRQQRVSCSLGSSSTARWRSVGAGAGRATRSGGSPADDGSDYDSRARSKAEKARGLAAGGAEKGVIERPKADRGTGRELLRGPRRPLPRARGPPLHHTRSCSCYAQRDRKPAHSSLPVAPYPPSSSSLPAPPAAQDTQLPQLSPTPICPAAARARLASNSDQPSFPSGPTNSTRPRSCFLARIGHLPSSRAPPLPHRRRSLASSRHQRLPRSSSGATPSSRTRDRTPRPSLPRAITGPTDSPSSPPPSPSLPPSQRQPCRSRHPRRLPAARPSGRTSRSSRSSRRTCSCSSAGQPVRPARIQPHDPHHHQHRRTTAGRACSSAQSRPSGRRPSPCRRRRACPLPASLRARSRQSSTAGTSSGATTAPAAAAARRARRRRRRRRRQRRAAPACPPTARSRSRRPRAGTGRAWPCPRARRSTSRRRASRSVPPRAR